MSQYRHGVYVEEQATSLVTPVTAESALPSSWAPRRCIICPRLNGPGQ